MGGTADGSATCRAVPNVPQILQLATSFKFEGPFAAPFSPLNPVNTMAAYAAWRKFKHGAYMTPDRAARQELHRLRGGGVPREHPVHVPELGPRSGDHQEHGGRGHGLRRHDGSRADDEPDAEPRRWR